MKRILSFLLFLLFVGKIFPQDKVRLAQSDSLYAEGVKLYNAGQYQEAIPLFVESDRIDKSELDSTNNRREYSAMWLASCYYKLGDVKKAESYNEYGYELPPIDRRLTIESDSLSMFAQQLVPRDLEGCLNLCNEIYRLEYQTLGGETLWSMNTRLTIASISALSGNQQLANEQVRSVLDDCDKLYGDCPRFKRYILSCAISVYAIKGTFADVKSGFDELFAHLDAIGEGESQFAADNWKGLADVYMQVGLFDGYEQAMERTLDITKILYGEKSNEYVGLLLMGASDLGTKMQRYEAALNYVEKANLLFEFTDKVEDYRLQCLVIESASLMGLRRMDDAKRTLKKALRKIDINGEDCEMYISGITSMLVMIRALEGKSDEDLLAEIVSLRKQIAEEKGRSNIAYSLTSMSLMLSYWMDGESGAAVKIADESVDAFIEGVQYVPSLFFSSIVYMNADYYVKSRKASSSALEILNKSLDRKYAGTEVAQSRSYIETGLNLVNQKLSQLGSLVADTTRYSLAMTKQNLLQAKLKIMEHTDSLATPEFFSHLKDYVLVGLKDTRDVLMVDSILGNYTTRIKEAFGESSQAYRQVVEIRDIAQFEQQHSRYAWNLNFYKSLNDSLKYATALAEYNEAYALWKKDSLDYGRKSSFDYVDSMPKTPYIWDVLKVRNYEEAMAQYKVVFDLCLEKIGEDDFYSYQEKLTEAIVRWSLCADSLGLSHLVIPELMKWRDKLMEIKETSYYTWESSMSDFLSVLWLRSDVSTYEQLEKEICDLIQVEENRFTLQISAMLNVPKVIDGYPLNSLYRHSLEASMYRLDYLLNVLKRRGEEFFDLYLAAFCGRSILVWNEYWDYGLKDRKELMDDFVALYNLFLNKPEYHQYSEGYEAMNMLCDMAYDAKDYQLVVDVDALRRKMKKTKDAAGGYSSSLLSHVGVDCLPYFSDSYRGDKDHLETRISLAYYEVGNRPRVEYEYDKLMESWNEVRQIQHNDYYIGEALNVKIDKLIKKACRMLYLDSDSISRLAYDIALFGKGYLLRSEQQMIKVLQQSGNRTIAKKYSEYLSLRQKLDDSTLPIDEVEGLKVQAESMLDELRRSSKLFDDYTKSLETSWRDVQACLDDDDMAIEYLNDGDYYYALVLRKGYEAPVVERKYSLSDLIDKNKDSLYTQYVDVWPDSYGFKKGEFVDLKLYDGVKNIYVSPSGILHLVAMENMIYSQYRGDSLMCEKYNIYRVSNTREIMAHKKATEKKHAPIKATLYGGIDYHLDDKSWAEISMKYQANDNMYALRDIPSFDRGAVMALAPLEGSRDEVMQIGKMLEECKLEVDVLTQTDATEDDLKRLSGSDVNLMHIATHGFYQRQEEWQDSTTMTFVRSDDDDENKALGRSGLFMAGASSWFYGETIPNHVNDGIVTAREIAHLDLTSMNLVVLSACETGLGDITGDGVFGLQRGFKKAGVQSVVMSLWKVDDEATRLLMVEFYTNLVVRKQSKLQALVNAQHYLRTYGDGRYAHPRYWAAFILLDGID